MSNPSLKMIAEHLLRYLSGCEQVEGVEQVSLCDPIAGRVVGSHYSLSHYFGALCLQAYLTGNTVLRDKGISVFYHINATHSRYVKEPDYHFDFNNFIWALLYKLNQKHEGLLPKSIEEQCKILLLNTGDSRHGTTNWLPMRAFNNAVRFELTGKRTFSRIRDKLLKQIYRVQNSDGMFEDNVVKGKSANPQYHVYTLAGLLLGDHCGCWETDSEKISNNLSFFLKHIAPDGDFNFYGRGTNQIFGWGPALLLLKNITDADELFQRSSAYVLRHLPSCLDKNGLLLENSSEHQQFQWRFYHYVSVYVAHFYFWTSLAELLEIPMSSHIHSMPDEHKSENITLIHDGPFFSLIFGGMKRYLQERGPMICGIWLKNQGCIFKGPFGPFFECPPGQYRHIAASCVIANHMGVVVDRGDQTKFSLTQTPVFPTQLEAAVIKNDLCFDFRFKKLPVGAKFVVPIFSHHSLSEDHVNAMCCVNVEGRNLRLWKYGSAIGPYHDLDLYCTQPLPNTREIRFFVRDQGNI
jgi:hypothetical protein